MERKKERWLLQRDIEQSTSTRWRSEGRGGERGGRDGRERRGRGKVRAEIGR